MQHLLVQSASFREPQASFDGLGDDTTSYPVVCVEKCRVRQLSAREQYQNQGDSNQSTHRVYIMGDMKTKTYAKPENVIVVDNVGYRIQTVQQGKTLTEHHIEIDCIVTEGVLPWN